MDKRQYPQHCYKKHSKKFYNITLILSLKSEFINKLVYKVHKYMLNKIWGFRWRTHQKKKKCRQDIGAMIRNLLAIFINCPFTIGYLLYLDPETCVSHASDRKHRTPVHDPWPIPYCPLHVSSAYGLIENTAGKWRFHRSLRLRP